MRSLVFSEGDILMEEQPWLFADIAEEEEVVINEVQRRTEGAEAGSDVEMEDAEEGEVAEEEEGGGDDEEEAL